MNNYNANLIKWACEEVDKQGESALSVPGFLNAWDFAHTTPYPIQKTIKCLNARVCDSVRIATYRTTPVTFLNGNTGAKADQIHRLMDQLCDSDLWDMDRQAFVLEFLKIHPFEDGNGRVAAILMNTNVAWDPNSQAFRTLSGSERDSGPFIPVPSEDGWDEGYGSQVELVDFEDDEHGCGRPVIQMNI